MGTDHSCGPLGFILLINKSYLVYGYLIFMCGLRFNSIRVWFASESRSPSSIRSQDFGSIQACDCIQKRSWSIKYLVIFSIEACWHYCISFLFSLSFSFFLIFCHHSQIPCMHMFMLLFIYTVHSIIHRLWGNLISFFFFFPSFQP